MRIAKVTAKERRFIDILMIAGGIIGPLSAIPQIMLIYGNQDAGSVSLTSWALFSVLSIIGLVYSIVHREKIILLGYSLYTIADISIVIGIILYG